MSRDKLAGYSEEQHRTLLTIVLSEAEVLELIEHFTDQHGNCWYPGLEYTVGNLQRRMSNEGTATRTNQEATTTTTVATPATPVDYGDIDHVNARALVPA